MTFTSQDKRKIPSVCTSVPRHITFSPFYLPEKGTKTDRDCFSYGSREQVLLEACIQNKGEFSILGVKSAESFGISTV